MGAKVLMGAEMDVFQAARLKYWWFAPVVMDHSGVSTAKSETAFVFAFLRLLLLPLAAPRTPRIVSVYYQSQGTAEEVFLPKLEHYVGQSNWFFKQIKLQRGRALYRTMKNVIRIDMKEGGWCELPAGDFIRDSQGNASKRMNDLIADEAPMMDQMGRGLDKQLLQRNTRECFNPHHPVHANHTILLGHAESPEHPYHKRYAGLRRKIMRECSQDHVTITSGFEDYRGVFKQKYGEEPAKKFKDQVGADLDEAEGDQIFRGLWKRGGKGLYPKTLRDGLHRADLRVHLRRADDELIYGLGWDSAPGMKEGADLNAGVVLGARWVPGGVVPPEEVGLPGYHRIDDELWFIWAAYAVQGRRLDVDQRSGIVHRLHRAFGFAVLTLDSQGGGIDLYKKMRESRQLIDNEWQEVDGLCTPADTFEWPMAQPLVSFYDRSDPLFRPEFGEKYVADNSGPVDYSHRQMRSVMGRRSLAWPAPASERGPQDLADWLPEELEVLAELERALAQFGNVSVKVDKAGQPVLSEKGFQRFSNRGKKDYERATQYAFRGLVATLRRMEGRRETASAPSCKVYS